MTNEKNKAQNDKDKREILENRRINDRVPMLRAEAKKEGFRFVLHLEMKSAEIFYAHQLSWAFDLHVSDDHFNANLAEYHAHIEYEKARA